VASHIRESHFYAFRVIPVHQQITGSMPMGPSVTNSQTLPFWSRSISCFLSVAVRATESTHNRRIGAIVGVEIGVSVGAVVGAGVVAGATVWCVAVGPIVAAVSALEPERRPLDRG